MYEICDVVHKIYKMFLINLIRCGASRDKDTSVRAEMIQLQWKMNAYFVSFMSLLHLDMMKKETDEENKKKLYALVSVKFEVFFELLYFTIV